MSAGSGSKALRQLWLALNGLTTEERVSAPAIMDDQPSLGTRKTAD